MAVPSDEHERTMAFAEIAFGQIRALRQPASPRHFEVWYTYATGYNPSLNQTINETLARCGTLSEAQIDEIYETYISAQRVADRIDRVGSQVMGEIEQVMAMIGAAAGNATTYSESLASVTQNLGAAADEPAVRAIVESLVHATKQMQQNNLALEERLSASKQEINQLQENLEVVRTESLTDPLTSLANRKYLDEALVKAIAAASGKGEPLSLLMTDIDHFKHFNDTFGHLTGDQVLRLVAMSVKQNVKGQDTAARYGGEGVRGRAAQHRAATGGHARRSHPQRGDEQGIEEALHRRESRTHHGLGRGGVVAAGRYAAGADRARRHLPLCRQAQRPQPGDQRGRSRGRNPGAKGGVRQPAP